MGCIGVSGGTACRSEARPWELKWMNSLALHSNFWGENFILATVTGCESLNVLTRKASDIFVGDFPAVEAVRIAARDSNGYREDFLEWGCEGGWSVPGHGRGWCLCRCQMTEVVQTGPQSWIVMGHLSWGSASNARLNPPITHPSVSWSANSVLFSKDTVMGLCWEEKTFSM